MGDFDLAQQKIIKEKMKAKTEANRAAKLIQIMLPILSKDVIW
jgi:hypothetical protein